MLTPGPEPLVSVLIVTWNRREDVGRSIRSALEQTYPRVELVVVDNGSSDGTADAVAAAFPSAQVVRLPANVGCPSGRNAGFVHCQGDYVYQLDDDGWLDPDAVRRAVMRAEADGRIGLVMSQIREFDARGVVRVRPRWTSPAFVFHFSGGCSMIRREALEDAGPYPDDFFRQGEEADLALRLYDRGWACAFEPSSVMYHRPSPAGRSADLTLRLSLRNTNRTGLRLWPFPWCVLRPLVTGVHAVREAVTRRYWALPAELSVALIRDLWTLRLTRRPVSREAFRLCRALQARPSATITLRGARRVLLPLPAPDAAGAALQGDGARSGQEEHA